MNLTVRWLKQIVAFGVLALSLHASTLDASEASPTQSATVDYGVALCTNGGQSEVDAATRAAVIRAVVPGSRSKVVGFRVIACNAAIGDASCFAQDRVLICRASVIERTLRAAAWMAKQYEGSSLPSYDDFRLVHRRWNVDATRYADRVDANPAVDAALASLMANYVKFQAAGLTASAENLSPAQQVYIATVDYVLAALIGHELSHVLGERCPLPQKAAVEDLSLDKRFLSLHQSGELFCRRPPSLEEVRADVCGLRHIRATTQSLAAHRADARYTAFARRVSADLIAFNVTFGWRPRPNAPVGKYPFMELNEYLYAPMRVLAYAVELTPPAKGSVSVCGESASLFVFGTQQLFKSCPKAKGNVADDLLALLPPAVEAAWNGAPWLPATFACAGR